MAQETYTEKLPFTINGQPAFLCRILKPSYDWFIDNNGKWGMGFDRKFLSKDGQWTAAALGCFWPVSEEQALRDFAESMADPQPNKKRVRKSVPLF